MRQQHLLGYKDIGRGDPKGPCFAKILAIASAEKSKVIAVAPYVLQGDKEEHCPTCPW